MKTRQQRTNANTNARQQIGSFTWALSQAGFSDFQIGNVSTVPGLLNRMNEFYSNEAICKQLKQNGVTVDQVFHLSFRDSGLEYFNAMASFFESPRLSDAGYTWADLYKMLIKTKGIQQFNRVMDQLNPPVVNNNNGQQSSEPQLKEEHDWDLMDLVNSGPEDADQHSADRSSEMLLQLSNMQKLMGEWPQYELNLEQTHFGHGQSPTVSLTSSATGSDQATHTASPLMFNYMIENPAWYENGILGMPKKNTNSW